MSGISSPRNITISGRIGSGATTLAKGIAQNLGWHFLEGGEIFAEFYKASQINEIYTDARPDDFDLAYEKKIKTLLENNTHQVIQSHLAGFDAQEIPGVFKILAVCENEEGKDELNVRIDRLVNRKDITVEEAKHEIREREAGNLAKWRRLYAQNDSSWVYWDHKFYDLVVNTYTHNRKESLHLVLSSLKQIT